MAHKEQNKILDDKIESNVNQYKVDRLNAEISAFSSGDLNKYEFLTRKDSKYKPNALDKARFEFSPLGKAFSMGLDKTAQGYQEEGVRKLLKYIRDGLAGGIAPREPRALRGPGLDDPNNDHYDYDDYVYDDYIPDYNDDRSDDRPDEDDNITDEDNNIPDLKTEEEAAERIVDSYEQKKDNCDNIIKNLKNRIDKLNAKINDSELSNKEKDKLNKEYIKSNNKLEDFIKIYNDIVHEDKDKIYSKLSKFKNNMEDNINKLEKINECLDKFDNKMSVLNDKISKIKYTIKNKNLTSAEKDELQNKIKDLENQKHINNELTHAVHIMKKKFPEKFKKFEEFKKPEFTESEDDFNVLDESGIHKYTHTKYDFGGFDRNGFDRNGFDRNGFNKGGLNRDGFDRDGFDVNYFNRDGLHKDTKYIYNPNGFDKDGFNKDGLHRDTKFLYNREGFNKNGLHKDTKDKYDPYGLDRDGKHKDADTFLDKEKNIRKDISKNINWLKDKDKFLKLYDEIIKNGEFSVNTKNGSISSNMFKYFLEDTLSGNIKDNEVEDYIEGINDIEKELNKSIKSKKNDKLKDYINKIKDLVYKKDKERIKTDQAKSFKDQKGKGHINLPIALSKIYTNNSSKELINNIKQLINDLYDNEQITKQVYNNLIKATTYKKDS